MNVYLSAPIPTTLKLAPAERQPCMSSKATRCGSAFPPTATSARPRFRRPRLPRSGMRRQKVPGVGAELIWLDFDDEFLIDSVETRHAFIEAFRIARPEVIFCHWREDYNPDHSISGMIVDECAAMGGVPRIKTASPPTDEIPHVYFMDTPAGVNFVPEIYVDITRTFAKKVQMLSAHASQNQWMNDIFGYDLEAFWKFRRSSAACRPVAQWPRPSGPPIAGAARSASTTCRSRDSVRQRRSGRLPSISASKAPHVESCRAIPSHEASNKTGTRS